MAYNYGNRLMMKLLFFVTLALINGISNAQWYEGEGDERKLAPSETWQGSSGEFGAMIMLTNDAEDFFNQWNKPASTEYKPALVTVDEARRGDVVVAIVLFSGCGADKYGNCNSKVDYKVINPDGSVYANISDGELWVNKPTVPSGSMQVSVKNLGFEIELDDQLGEYRIEATVRDLVKDVEIDIFRTLQIGAIQSENE